MSLLAYIRAASGQTSNLTNPQLWLTNWAAGGGATSSGENVNADSAMLLPAYAACIRVIAEDIAKIPLITYRREGRGKIRATDHPVYRLLHDEPNPDMTAFSFREVVTAHALGWGCGFAEIVRGMDGSPEALHPIHPSRVTWVRSAGGRIVYRVAGKWEVNGRAVNTVEIPAENMFVIHGLGSDGISGDGASRYGREAIGRGAALQRFAASFFGNGANPSFIIKVPGQLTDEAKANLRNSFRNAYAGPSGSHQAVVVDARWEIEPLTIDPQKAQAVEANYQSVEEICRLFRVAPHKIMHMQRAQGWSTIEAANTAHVVDTLMPWAVRWEQEAARRLFVRPSDSGFFAEHLFAGLLRGDMTARSNFYRAMWGIGVYSPNEIRALENENGYPGGDERYVPLNMTPVSEAGEQPAERPADRGAMRAALAVSVSAAVERTYEKIRKAHATADKKKHDPRDYSAWLDEFYGRIGAELAGNAAPAIRAAMIQAGADPAAIERAVSLLGTTACAAAYKLRDAAREGEDGPAAESIAQSLAACVEIEP